MAQSFLRCLCGPMAMYIEWLFDLARILKCEKVYGEWKRINGYTRKFKKVGSHLLFDWRYQTEPHQTWWKFTSDSNYPTRNSRPENDCSRKPIQTLIEKSDNFLSKHIHQVIKTDKVSVSISHGNHFEEIDKFFQVLSLAPEKKETSCHLSLTQKQYTHHTSIGTISNLFLERRLTTVCQTNQIKS